VLEFDYTSHPSHVLFGVGTTGGQRLARAVEQLGVGRILLVAAEPERELADRRRSHRRRAMRRARRGPTR
jgi:hypothetical protein